ncbi:UDP-glucuronic acid decarboxylase 6, partial [Sarracenia purpurea var. burkii]
FLQFAVLSLPNFDTRFSISRRDIISSMASNGHTTKPPPNPSPLRNAKFFQANMRILVIGGAGFIGSHLVDRLMQNKKNEA